MEGLAREVEQVGDIKNPLFLFEDGVGSCEGQLPGAHSFAQRIKGRRLGMVGRRLRVWFPHEAI